MKATTVDVGSPTILRAGGISFNEYEFRTFFSIVVYTEMAIAPPAKRFTPASPPLIPSSTCGTPS